MANPFADKARKNLVLGTSLLQSGETNAAANRLYYALFQAAVHVLETRHGKRPENFSAGAKRWRHDIVGGITFLLRDNGSDKIIYTVFRNLREEADYKLTTVEKDRLAGRLKAVTELVMELTK